MIKRIISILIILLLTAGMTEAWTFSDLFQSTDRWSPLSKDLISLNTPQNIETLSKSMAEYGVSSVRIDVTDIGKSFYVVKNKGVVLTSTQNIDGYLRLTESQIRTVIGILDDGRINPFERFQLWLMFKR